jgi:hypothetical protein
MRRWRSNLDPLRLSSYPRLDSLERIRSYPRLVLITVHRVSVILEANTIAILIYDLTCIIQCRIFIDDGRRGLEHIDKEHTEKQTNQKRQKLYVIEKFHGVTLIYNTKLE